MELALLMVMVAVEMMILSLDLSSKLVVLDTIADTKLCQTWKEINSWTEFGQENIWVNILVLYYMNLITLLNALNSKDG